MQLWEGEGDSRGNEGVRRAIVEVGCHVLVWYAIVGVGG